MTEAELKAKLEKSVGPVSVAEWLDLRDADVQLEYEENPWAEFVGWVKERLDASRLHDERVRLEQKGELEIDIDAAGEVAAPAPNDPPTLSDRTSARSSALSALDRLRAGDIRTRRARIHSSLFPRGGIDRTIPQWVILMAVEAWIPADEVKEAYRSLQHPLLAEQRPPKTTERAFQVAKFVWEQRQFYGTRPSWKVLTKRWNDLPWSASFEWAKPFKNWQAFRMSFERGKRATPPQYVASDDQMIELIRSSRPEEALEAWMASLRE
jgi:hypothetical protein